MPLVAGVDSSTQSTKVELRDAETGAAQPGDGPAPADPAAPVGTGSGVVVDGLPRLLV